MTGEGFVDGPVVELVLQAVERVEPAQGQKARIEVADYAFDLTLGLRLAEI